MIGILLCTDEQAGCNRPTTYLKTQNEQNGNKLRWWEISQTGQWIFRVTVMVRDSGKKMRHADCTLRVVLQVEYLFMCGM